MRINSKKLEDAGIEIIEELHNVRLERPIDLRSLNAFNINHLYCGNYEVIVDKEEIYEDDLTTTFSIYKNRENVLSSGTLYDLKDYLVSKGFCE